MASDPPVSKICGNCEREKPAAAFQKNATKSDGLQQWCRDCMRAMRLCACGHSVSSHPRVGSAKPCSAVGCYCVDFARAPYEPPPLEAVPDGYEASKVATLVDPESGVEKQWIQAKPEVERAPLIATLPAGHIVKGVSTLVDGEGKIRAQWQKTATDKERYYDALMEAMKGIADAWTGLHEPVAAPASSSDDLLCVYPMGDPHVGMFAWALETGGDDFDLRIAERNMVAAIDHLVAGAPPAREALVINLGDFFHADNQSNQTTRSHHALDVDTRWAKVLRVGVRIMRRVVERALAKHERVRVICEIGNHDDHSSQMLAACLEQFFERDERVVVDVSPAKFHWYEFGANLIGVTHGDTIKLSDLPGIMACDQQEAWGRTAHHHWYSGHVHHDSFHEFRGCTVETLRTLAPRDAWHASKGYRSGQDMKVDVWHRKHGRDGRHIVSISRIREITSAA